MDALWIILGVICYFLIGAVIAGIGLRTEFLDNGPYDSDAIVVIMLWPFALILGIVVLIVIVFGQIAFWIAKKKKIIGESYGTFNRQRRINSDDKTSYYGRTS